MTRTVTDVRHFRRKAQSARQDAQDCRDEEARRLITAMAAFYDRLADHYERENAERERKAG